MGPYAEIKPLATGFFNVKLPRKNNLELSGSVTRLPQVESSKVLKEAAETLSTAPRSIKDVVKKGGFVKPYAEDVYKKGPEEAAEGWLDSLFLKNFKEQFKNIIGVSIGGGKIYAAQDFRTPDRYKYDAPKSTVEDTHALANQQIANFFEHDSADFSKVVQRPEWDYINRTLTGRTLIEMFFALNLGLVLDPDGTIKMVGHASPEGPLGPLPAGKYDPYNDTLSEDRVDAVHYAVIDAMELFPSAAWPLVDPVWKGESVARDYIQMGGGGLSDPPGTVNAPEFLFWLKHHESEVRLWPEWRRVDVRIGGVVLLRLFD